MTIHARSLRRLTLEILSQRDRSPDSKRNIVGYKVGSRKTYRHVCCSVRSFLARWIVSKRISKPRCSRRSERSGGGTCSLWEQEIDEIGVVVVWSMLRTGSEREWDTPREVYSRLWCDTEERVRKRVNE